MDPAPGGDLALVLSGGGARAAYQAGALRTLARLRPDLEVPILTGVSAGAINAAFLASRPGSFQQKAEELCRLWNAVAVEQVFRADTPALVRRALRLLWHLAFGGRGVATPLQGLLDTAPLRAFLERGLSSDGGSLHGIEENLRARRLRAVAVTASSYSTGQTVTWVQGQPIENWERANRRSAQCSLVVEHIMASSALPLLFPAVQVDGAWYGDGGIRLTAPLSPAVHLGAGRIIAISVRRARTRAEADRPVVSGYPPAAQVLGQLLNAIFLDVFDADALAAQRINRLIENLPPERREGLRPVALLLLRPSRDLGQLANDYEARLPRAFRLLTRRLGTRETRSNDLLSLLMFQPDYIRRLLELGAADAEARAGELEALLGP